MPGGKFWRDRPSNVRWFESWFWVPPSFDSFVVSLRTERTPECPFRALIPRIPKFGGRQSGVLHYCTISTNRTREAPRQTANNRKSPHMLPQSLDIFKISGTADNYWISLVPFKLCWYICVNVIIYVQWACPAYPSLAAKRPENIWNNAET